MWNANDAKNKETELQLKLRRIHSNQIKVLRDENTQEKIKKID